MTGYAFLTLGPLLGVTSQQWSNPPYTIMPVRVAGVQAKVERSTSVASVQPCTVTNPDGSHHLDVEKTAFALNAVRKALVQMEITGW